MAWETRLTEKDYSVHRNGHTVVFRDNRNRRAYELGVHVTQAIRQQIGLMQPDSLWIQIAINQGLIPHPYDEYV